MNETAVTSIPAPPLILSIEFQL